MFWVILLIILVIVIVIYVKFFRMPALNTINFVDGTNGVGKTQLCVYWSRRAIRRQRIFYKYIEPIINKIFKRKQDKKPYLYSNLAMKDTPFVKVSLDLLTRENYRCSKNSVLLLDEYSLVADQNIYGKAFEKEVEKMRDFWKLCRHEGFKYIFVNSQNISSVNYTLKDCISNYIYIHHRRNIRILGFSIVYYYEMAYSRDDKNIMNTFSNRDSDFKRCIVPNRIFKKYDSRAYSIFTDYLPVLENEVVIKDRKELKQSKLVSFMKLNYLYKNIEKKEGEKENGQ